MSEPLTKREDRCYDEVWLTAYVVGGAYQGQDRAKEAAEIHRLPKPEGRGWTADWWQERPAPDAAWRLGWLRDRQSPHIHVERAGTAAPDPSRPGHSTRSDRIEKDVLERFLQRLQVGTDDECWEWQGEQRQLGTVGSSSKTAASPRTSCLGAPVRSVARAKGDSALSVGPTLHRVPSPDDPPCCRNPWHVYPGTHQDNLDDVDRTDWNIGGKSA